MPTASETPGVSMVKILASCFVIRLPAAWEVKSLEAYLIRVCPRLLGIVIHRLGICHRTDSGMDAFSAVYAKCTSASIACTKGPL
jgi:hypothetical protein